MRTAAVQDAISAMQLASDEGRCVSRPSQVLSSRKVALRNLAVHDFSVKFSGVSEADAGRLQRGRRSRCRPYVAKCSSSASSQVPSCTEGTGASTCCSKTASSALFLGEARHAGIQNEQDVQGAILPENILQVPECMQSTADKLVQFQAVVEDVLQPKAEALTVKPLRAASYRPNGTLGRKRFRRLAQHPQLEHVVALISNPSKLMRDLLSHREFGIIDGRSIRGSSSSGQPRPRARLARLHSTSRC